MLPQEVIRHKRDGQKLTKEEIDFFVKGVSDWSVSECQIAAFTMAVYLRGMENEEIVHLTRAMTLSGEIMQWGPRHLSGPVLDKHSTGGVGDKVNMVLAPMIAACGGFVPLIAGRGIGYVGGTLDKFDSIPGYISVPSLETFYQVTQNVGCAIIGQTVDLAPADKRIYAIRDISATVESVPLFAASILSKKLAAGAEGVIIDLKCGNGAFAENIKEAQSLAKTIVAVSAGAGLPAKAVLTDMNQVLGQTVGNALEVGEAIAYLKGEFRDPCLHDITMTLCAEALTLKGLAGSNEEAREKLQTALDKGKAAEIFAKMVTALGGPADLIDDPWKYLPKAPIVRPVYAAHDGYVSGMDTRGIGLAMIALGGQRTTADQRLDLSVGFSGFARIGEEVNQNRPIAFIHAANEESFAEAEKMVQNKVQTSAEKPAETPLIYDTITND